jgi:hypothetical protein
MVTSSGHTKYPSGSYDHYPHEAGIGEQQANMTRCHADDQYNDAMNAKYDEMRLPSIHERCSGSSHDDYGSNEQPSHNTQYNSNASSKTSFFRSRSTAAASCE